jgi:hypothetical protein
MERSHHRNIRLLQRIARRSIDYQRVVRRVLLCIQVILHSRVLL